MASTGAMAVMKAKAAERLQKATDALAEKLGIDVPQPSPANRDPELARIQQMEAQADLLEAVLETVGGSKGSKGKENKVDTNNENKPAEQTNEDAALAQGVATELAEELEESEADNNEPKAPSKPENAAKTPAKGSK